MTEMGAEIPNRELAHVHGLEKWKLVKLPHYPRELQIQSITIKITMVPSQKLVKYV